jgi:hypothetical protein
MLLSECRYVKLDRPPVRCQDLPADSLPIISKVLLIDYKNLLFRAARPSFSLSSEPIPSIA